HQALNVSSARQIRADGLQTVEKGFHRTASDVHRSDDVLETCMLRRRIHPPCSLQLMDLTHPLYPWMIDDRPLRYFVFVHNGYKGNVSMDRIMAHTFAI